MCRDIDHGGRRCPRSTAAGKRQRRAEHRTRQADEQMRAFIGATPFRPESGDLMRMSSRPSYYDTDEWIEYDESLRPGCGLRGLTMSYLLSNVMNVRFTTDQPRESS